MAKITFEALEKRGWVKSGEYHYLKGNHLVGDNNSGSTTNGYSYRLDKYPNCDLYMLDLPYPNSDMGGWFCLREVGTLKQLNDLIKALEIKI